MSVRPRFCKYCGKPFEEGHRYCARCGKPILPPEQDAGDLAQEVAEMSSAALCEVGESADMQQEPAAVADVELAEAECADDAVESQAEEAAEPQAAEELVEPQSAEEPVELLAEELSDSQLPSRRPRNLRSRSLRSLPSLICPRSLLSRRLRRSLGRRLRSLSSRNLPS